jgi:hypothetical protein
VHRGLSPVEAYHTTRAGGPLWCLAGAGDDRQPGASDHPGDGRARG